MTNFHDTTVHVFKLNPDGSKGEKIREQEPFPEGWGVTNLHNYQEPKKEVKQVGKTRLDKETLTAKAKEEIAKGRTAQAVGQELGLAKSTLHNWLHTEPKEVDRPTNEQLRLDYYETKVSKSALMRKYHVSWYTVEKWCKEAGIDMAKKPKEEKEDKPVRSMGCIEPVAMPLGVEIPKEDWQVADEDPIPYTLPSDNVDLAGFRLELVMEAISIGKRRGIPNSDTLDAVKSVMGQC